MTLPRRCLDCRRLIASGSRCAHCEPSTTARGYGTDWQRIRTAVLERDRHTCQWCGQPAETVDHVRALAHGGARLNPSNLVAACLRCNSRRGATTRRKF
jgi:5-methylcytosine-specific restriction endonuclease McrA